MADLLEGSEMVVHGRCVEEYAGKIRSDGRQGEGRAGWAPAMVDEIGLFCSIIRLAVRRFY